MRQLSLPTGTPFGPFWIFWRYPLHFTEELLAGTLTPTHTDTDLYGDLLFEHMCCPPGMPEELLVPDTISTIEHVGNWKRAYVLWDIGPPFSDVQKSKP